MRSCACRCARRRRRSAPPRALRASARTSGGDTGDRGDALGREAGDQLAEPVEAVDELARAAPRSARPSAKSVCAIPASKSGVGAGADRKWMVVRGSAVLVRRGSTTTTLPPRARIAASLPGKSGAVARLPFDSAGWRRA